MKREARLLKAKAIDAVLVAVESFNRPVERGRADSVLRNLSHSFEMLMKAAIVQRGGRIRQRGAPQTIGFDVCVRKGLSERKVQFLSDEQALTIQVLNALRDAAEHHLVEVSEQQLYLQAQASLTLFADILVAVFEERLSEHVPERVLPLTTSPPKDLGRLIGDEIAIIRELVQPGLRKRVDARARIKSIAIMEAAIGGAFVQPGDDDLNRLLDRVAQSERWERLFPGVASLKIDDAGDATPYSLRITKKEGVPIHLVSEGDGSAVVAIRKVDKLGYYNMGLRKLAKHVPGLSEARLAAVVAELGLREDDEYYAEFAIDSQYYKRFSKKALDKVLEALPALDVEAIWAARRPSRKRRGQHA